MSAAAKIDEINRAAWRTRNSLRTYAERTGWLDPGEAAAVAWVAAEVRGTSILDIGVGGGRTIPLLTALSPDYVGIDYTEEFVDLSRSRHPQARVLHMDARDLAAFEDASFGLVLFSFNGIDVVDHDDRLKILHEVHRVLRPAGLLVFSTHNRDGPGHREPFLRLKLTANPLKLGWRLLRLARTLPITVYNHWRLRRLNSEFDGYSVRNASAHDFGVVVVLTSQREQRRQLEAVGLRTEIVFDNVRGLPVAENADTRGTWWFHFVARKAPPRAMDDPDDVARFCRPPAAGPQLTEWVNYDARDRLDGGGIPSRQGSLERTRGRDEKPAASA